MTFIEKLKKLYRDNIWKEEKRKKDHQEAGRLNNTISKLEGQ